MSDYSEVDNFGSSWFVEEDADEPARAMDAAEEKGDVFRERDSFNLVRLIEGDTDEPARIVHASREEVTVVDKHYDLMLLELVREKSKEPTGAVESEVKFNNLLSPWFVEGNPYDTEYITDEEIEVKDCASSGFTNESASEPLCDPDSGVMVNDSSLGELCFVMDDADESGCIASGIDVVVSSGFIDGSAYKPVGDLEVGVDDSTAKDEVAGLSDLLQTVRAVVEFALREDSEEVSDVDPLDGERWCSRSGSVLLEIDSVIPSSEPSSEKTENLRPERENKPSESSTRSALDSDL